MKIRGSGSALNVRRKMSTISRFVKNVEVIRGWDSEEGRSLTGDEIAEILIRREEIRRRREIDKEEVRKTEREKRKGYKRQSKKQCRVLRDWRQKGKVIFHLFFK